MIYTVLSFFAFYALSAAGSRRLLQHAPEYVPIIQAQTTNTPVAPATTAAATLPAVTLPAATNPGQGHGNGNGNGNVVLPWTLPPLPMQATEKLECVMAYTEPGNCAGQIKTITN
eukprot:370290_1